MAHTFDVTVRWLEGFRGEAEAGGATHTVPWAVPREFGGPGGEWTPEHFLASAVSTCVMATFLSIAQMSKLSIKGYESKASCTMEKTAEGLRITSVKLTPRILVSVEPDLERAHRMIEKAERLCPISNSLKTVLSMEASVEVAA